MKAILTIAFFVLSAQTSFSQTITAGDIPITPEERGTQTVIGKKGDKTYVFRIPKNPSPRSIKVFFGREDAPIFSTQPEKSYGVANSDEAISNVENYFHKNPYYFLDVYDAQMNLIKSSKIDAIVKLNRKYRTESKILFPRKLYFKDGEIMVISTYYESDINKLSIGYSKLDEEGILDKNLTVFAEMSSDNNHIEADCRLQFSPDSSGLLFYCRTTDPKKKSIRLLTKVIDTKTFSLVNENEFEFPLGDGYLKIEDVKVDNNNKVWVLLQSKLVPAIPNESKSAFFKYNLYVCPRDKESMKEVKIQISESDLIQHIALETDHTGAYISGSYSSKSTSVVQGLFLQKMNNDLVISHFKIPLNKELNLTGEKFLHVRQIKQLENNHYLLIGENYHTELTLEPGGYIGSGQNKRPAYGQYLYFFYEEIFIVDLNEKGELVWIKTIPKYQKEVNTENEASSYFATIENGKISVLFNASETGLSMVSGKEKVRPAAGIQLFQYDYSGEVIRKELFRDVANENYMIPKGSKSTGNNEVIVYNYCKEKKHRYLKVTL